MAAKKSSPIHVIFGSDEGEIARAAKEFASRNAPQDAGEFGLETIDGIADNADQAATRIHQTIEALLTVPFFGGEKFVWLKAANFLSDSQTGRAAAVLEALEKLGELLSKGIPSGVQFLLSANDPDKRRTFCKLLTKVGTIEIFDKPDASKAGWEEKAGDIVEERASKHGVRFDADALNLFLARCGPETRVLDSELEKLVLYLGDERKRIAVEDVRLIVPLTKASVIWELGNAIIRRDLTGALTMLDQLLGQKETPIGILLVAIIPTVRNLLVAKDLIVSHKLRPPDQPHYFKSTLERLPREATQHLPRKKDGEVNAYALGLSAVGASKYSLPDLEKALAACLDANLQLVTSQLDAQLVLSQLLLRILQKPAATSAARK